MKSFNLEPYIVWKNKKESNLKMFLYKNNL
jgi:hypothetical protein